MKSTQKIAIALIIAIALMATVFLLNYPPENSQDALGAIGKVEKHKSGNLTESDIMLRTALFQDTLALKNTLKNLAEFTQFAKVMSAYIDEWWTPQLKQYGFPGCDDCISKLQDYSGFLKSNISTLNETVAVFSDYYKSSNKNAAGDIEHKLYNFAAFAQQMLQKDSVLENTLFDIEDYVCSDEAEDFNRREVTSKLKELHDVMLLALFQYSFTTGSKETAKKLVKSKLFNDKILRMTTSGKYIEVIAPKLNLSGADQTILSYGGVYYIPFAASSVVFSDGQYGSVVTSSLPFGIIYANGGAGNEYGGINVGAVVNNEAASNYGLLYEANKPVFDSGFFGTINLVDSYAAGGQTTYGTLLDYIVGLGPYSIGSAVDGIIVGNSVDIIVQAFDALVGTYQLGILNPNEYAVLCYQVGVI
jgi:hypothetical protein